MNYKKLAFDEDKSIETSKNVEIQCTYPQQWHLQI